MADVSKIKLPNNTTLNVKDSRIPGVDSTPTSGSSNLVTSGGVYSALSGKQETLVSGTNIKTVNNTTLLGSGNITVEPGVGFEDVSSQQDGTVVIALTNGDTVTIDLNHVHPQYPEYEHLEDESDMPATPDEDTMYLIDGSGGGGSSYTLPAATSAALGGIKIGYTQSGKNYPVALDNNNAAYVSLPTAIVYLTDESQMPVSPDSNTLYVILESQS